MKRVRIVTIINNYGEERYIIQHTIIVRRWIFLSRTVWETVSYVNSNDPFFYDDYFEALEKGRNILVNANPRQQRIVMETNVEEVTI